MIRMLISAVFILPLAAHSSELMLPPLKSSFEPVKIESSNYGEATIFRLGKIDAESVIPQAIDVHDGTLWIGTNRGLLKHATSTGGWWHANRRTGLPGDAVDRVSASERMLAVRVLENQEPFGSRKHSFWFSPGTGEWRYMPGAFDTATWDKQLLWFGRQGEFGFMDPHSDRIQVYGRKALVFLAGKPVSQVVADDWIWMALNDATDDENSDYPNGAIAQFNKETGRFLPLHRYQGLPHDMAYSLAVSNGVTWAGHWSHRSEEQLTGITRFDHETRKSELIPLLPDRRQIKARVLALAGPYLWFIDAEAGLVRMHTESLSMEKHPVRAALPAMLTLLVSDGRGVWVGGYQHGARGEEVHGTVAYVPNPSAWREQVFEYPGFLTTLVLVSVFTAVLALLVLRGRAMSLPQASSISLVILLLMLVVAYGLRLYQPVSQKASLEDRIQLNYNSFKTDQQREQKAVDDVSRLEIQSVSVIEDAGEKLSLEVAYRHDYPRDMQLYMGGDALIGSRRMHLTYNPDPAPAGEGKLRVSIFRPDRLPERFCTDGVLLTFYSPVNELDILAFDFDKIWQRENVDLLGRVKSMLDGCMPRVDQE